jgi:hypothetical protein
MCSQSQCSTIEGSHRASLSPNHFVQKMFHFDDGQNSSNFNKFKVKILTYLSSPVIFESNIKQVFGNVSIIDQVMAILLFKPDISSCVIAIEILDSYIWCNPT